MRNQQAALNQKRNTYCVSIVMTPLAISLSNCHNIPFFISSRLQTIIEKLHFTINRFYKDYIASGETVLERFYHKYQPLITREHHTCVGLGFELLYRLRCLNKRFPGIAGGLYLVSCEEVLFMIHKQLNYFIFI